MLRIVLVALIAAVLCPGAFGQPRGSIDASGINSHAFWTTGAGQTWFRGVGDLPGGKFLSNAYGGVSADGSTLAGDSETNQGSRAFRWTLADGMQELGEIPGSTWSRAHAISAEGSVIAGTFGTPASGVRAFRWTEASGMEELLDASGQSVPAEAFGISADGEVIIGSWDTGLLPSGAFSAFRWTESTGMAAFLPYLGASEAFGVSFDGAVVVGKAVGAYRWTEAGGMQLIGDWLPLAVSGDGVVVVGSIGNMCAARWTVGGGLFCLGTLPGTTRSMAYAASASGAVVVGVSDSPGGISKGFIWDEANGMRDVHDVLSGEYGLNLSGWSLTAVYGVSGDGRTLAGDGVNPCGHTEAWGARMGESPECYADCDGSGTLNIDDFLCFQINFALGEPSADCDGSCNLDIDDFLCLQLAFALGC